MKHTCDVLLNDEIKIYQMKRGNIIDWVLEDEDAEHADSILTIYYCPWCGVKLDE